MKKLINNQGKSIQVTESVYNECQKAFDKEGLWAACIKDTDGNSHMVILPENFK